MAMTKKSHAPLLPLQEREKQEKQQQHIMDTPSAVARPHSFLVYPIPSIADESFLQLIFRNTVKRSLFLGFGCGRFAVVELTSAAVAAEVEAAIHKTAAEFKGQEGGVAALQDVNGAREDVAAPHGNFDCVAAAVDDDDDDDAVEHMTLADLFTPQLPSPSLASASAPDREAPDFSHIPYLVWRDRPVHVVVSGVRVADFYESGGAVPVHHTKRSTDAEGGGSDRLKAGKRPRNNSGPTPDPSPSSSLPAGDMEGEAGRHPRGGAAVVAAATKPLFPKNCCQKCGSADHFTRHCDGSGTSRSSPSGAIAEVASTSVAAHVATQPRRGALSATAGATIDAPAPLSAKAKPTLHNTSKDQCKYCGSDAHLSRHCPNKN
ncbi:hypothetical protein JKF63_07836 [Porcisia hertigi]|uniref:CCHC-type domain-containing protein n=1 Tax=Porcisia hertigi TaxID=2761500 RepID=A0A836YJ91_9TRYP|nr:hypothetical protein JKF63_07836 [Porcisia hertigi]